jgi:hypothetical protein
MVLPADERESSPGPGRRALGNPSGLTSPDELANESPTLATAGEDHCCEDACDPANGEDLA